MLEQLGVDIEGILGKDKKDRGPLQWNPPGAISQLIESVAPPEKTEDQTAPGEPPAAGAVSEAQTPAKKQLTPEERLERQKRRQQREQQKKKKKRRKQKNE